MLHSKSIQIVNFSELVWMVHLSELQMNDFSESVWTVNFSGLFERLILVNRLGSLFQ